MQKRSWADMDVTQQIAEGVRRVMGARRVNASELSRRTGIKYASLNERLAGTTAFVGDELFIVADALDASVADIIERVSYAAGSISPGQLQRHANRWLHSVGIPFTMHTARHRFGTAVYQASGRDLRATQELLRHRSIASTVGYTWIDPAAGAGIVALLT